MLKLSEMKKALNEKFAKTTVKIQTERGEKSFRTYDNKLVRSFPAGVTLSPMDCTNVKHDKIAQVFDDIKRFIRYSEGAEISINSSDIFVCNFLNEKGKGYKVTVIKNLLPYSDCYDSSYKQVFFDIDVEKCEKS